MRRLKPAAAKRKTWRDIMKFKSYTIVLVLLCFIAAITVFTSCSAKAGSKKLKIGFIVKQPEEPWFQYEWKFADMAARKYGFEVIKIGATDGEKVLAAIDNLAAGDAKGFIICTPDVRLGPAIADRAEKNNLKLIAVDDRFLGPDGKPMENVVYLGISAEKIGENVGRTLYGEIKNRNWPFKDTAVCAVTFEELDTARKRTDGAISGFVASGFPKNRIFKAPQKTSDIPGAFDAVNVLLTQHPEVKYWLVCGMNDNAVLGAIRAMEGRGFTDKNTCGIGINGTEAVAEFEKTQVSGFYGSMLLSAREHGYKTAEMMFYWITTGKEPAKDTRTTGVLITRNNYKDY
jgi:L-arabinose transport system substrate-binding protein